MRWIFKLIGGIVVLAVLALGAVALVPSEKIAAIATKEISARTGRDVAFSGKIKPVFFPVLGVKTEAFTIGNADWADGGDPMLRADSLLVGVELLPLFSGEVRIKDFRLDGVELRLEKTSDGRANWELQGEDLPVADGDEASVSALPEFSLKNGRIRGGTVTYVDHLSGQKTIVTILDLKMSVLSKGAADMNLSVSYQGQVINVKADLNSIPDLLNSKLSGLSAKLDGDFGTIKYDGQIGLSPNVADGHLNVEITDFDAVADLAGIDGGLDLPFRRLGLAGKATFAEDGNMYLRGADISLDQNQITGDMDLRFEDKPMLTAKLTAGDLDFSAMLGGSQSDRSNSSQGWSTASIDVSGLHAVNADIALTTKRLDLGPAKLDAVRARLTLNDGRLVLGLTDIAAYDGHVSGQYVINGRGGLSMGGDIQASGIQLKSLLKDLADYDRLIAEADVRVKFLTSGDSVKALMQRLSGSGRVDIGAGEIIGLDIAGMLRNLDASYRGANNKTIFSKINGSFVITDGVLDNQDLVFEGGLVNATGAGQVDIGSRSVNYRLTPAAFSGGDGGGITVPVLVYGPWSDIGFRPDLQNLIDAELDKKRKILEENIKADVERTQKEVEEEVKKRAENAVQKALEDAARRALGLD